MKRVVVATSRGADLLAELEGAGGVFLALVNRHQADDDRGDDDERNDQHIPPSSRGVPENR